MKKSLRLVFNIIYALSYFYMIYIAYLIVFVNGGIYQGKLPENGRELLEAYIAYPSHAILNLITVFVAFVVGHFVFYILISSDLQTQSFGINCLAMSSMLCAVVSTTYVYEHLTAKPRFFT